MKKRTKIIATIGPASASEKVLGRMIKAGVNVGRVNFSHGTHKSNGKIIEVIKKIRQELNIPVGIMADLQGPRIRVLVDEDVLAKKGDSILISGSKPKKINPAKRDQKSKIIYLDKEGIAGNIIIGNEILIEDGTIKLKVIKKNKNCLEAKVVEGGIIKNHKGVNVPGIKLKNGALTEKDKEDLRFVLSKNVDFIALSFVGSAKEIKEVRNKIKSILRRENNLPQIVAKIEREEALKNIREIIAAADVIMVARGDLGIELDENKVVVYQKEIISQCLKAGKAVIVATQMLNSMIYNPRPTRAEVSDVSNAVIDHADAVMLSGETASGKYPLETIETMVEIIKRTEESPFDDLKHGFLGDSQASVSAAVANSAHELAKDSKASAIVVASVSGFTARMMARHRPEQNILVMTNSEKTHNQLTLLWGTESFILPDCKTLDELIDESKKIIIKHKLLKKKDKIVIVTGRPHVKREHMSLVKVEEIK